MTTCLSSHPTWLTDPRPPLDSAIHSHQGQAPHRLPQLLDEGSQACKADRFLGDAGSGDRQLWLEDSALTLLKLSENHTMV